MALALALALALVTPLSAQEKEEPAPLPRVPRERLYLAFAQVVALETAAGEDGLPSVTELWRAELKAHVNDLAVAADGSRVFAATSEGVHVLDAGTGKELRRLGAHPARRVILAEDGVVTVAEFEAGNRYRVCRWRLEGGELLSRQAVPGTVDAIAAARCSIRGQAKDIWLLLDIHARLVRLFDCRSGEVLREIDLDADVRKGKTILPQLLALPPESGEPACFLVTEYGKDSLAYYVTADLEVKPHAVDLGGRTEARVLALDPGGEHAWFFGPTGLLKLKLWSDEEEPWRREVLTSFQGAAFSGGGELVYLTVPYIEKAKAAAVLVYEPARDRFLTQLTVAGMTPYQTVRAPPPPAAPPAAPPGDGEDDERER